MVQRGDLLATINATGTLEPEEVVDVGAQIAGEIESFGKDPSDPSEADQLRLARRAGDRPRPARRRALQGRASNQARASLAKAEADVEQAAGQAPAGRARARAGPAAARRRGQISPQEFDDRLPTPRPRRPTWPSPRARVALAKANLEEASVNLGYTTIRSPVKGVDPRPPRQHRPDRRRQPERAEPVPDRQGPEPDGDLGLGQRDRRRPDPRRASRSGSPSRAFPRETFRGKVAQIRLNASMTQSVVTYTVVVDVDNAERQAPALPDGPAPVRGRGADATSCSSPTPPCAGQPAVHHVAPEYATEFAAALRERAAPRGRAARARRASRDRDAAARLAGIANGEFVRPVAVDASA